MILNIFKLRQKRKKQKRLHFIIDTSLSIVILILIVVLVTFNLYQPKISQPVILDPIEPEKPIEVLNPLEINFSLNSNIARFDSGIVLDIDYYNQGEEKIDKVEVSFESLSSAFSISNIQSVMLNENSQIASSNLLIKDIPSLERGELSLKVYFKKPVDPLIRQTAWRGVVNTEYLNESFNQDFTLTNICFLSDTNISAKAFYNSSRGDQLGIGPVPPIAGIPTSYWVFFEVDNLGNDLEDFLISARLPNYATLTDKRTLLVGNYSYNPENRRLIWQVNQINKSGGAYRAGFEIEILPTDDHVGKVLNILENISYRFNDALCGQEISLNLNNLDTDLRDDFINQKQGTVIE